MSWSESNIILAIVGMVGLFSTATIFQRSNHITSNYYARKKLATPQQEGQEAEAQAEAN